MRSRHGLGLLAICGLAFALMGISASGAQAAGCTEANKTAKPCWMVNGGNVTVPSTSPLHVTVGFERDPGVSPELPVLLTTSGKNTVEIECHKFEALIDAAAEGKAKGSAEFSECLTYITNTNGKHVRHEECDPINTPIKAGGEGEIALHEGVAVGRVTGTGGIFATIEFDETKCTLIIEPITISGTGWIEDCEGHFETEQVKHLIQENKLAASMLGGLKYGANAASIDGSIIVFFTDAAHSGLKFSGLAG